MTNVLILSPPSSGNRFMEAALKRCGVDATYKHGECVDIVDRFDFVVVLVRGVCRWHDSNVAANRWDGTAHSHWLGETTPHGVHQATFSAIFRAIADANKPFAVISYESLVFDGDDTMTMLCEWIGVEWAGWGETEQERRPWNRPPFDANAKYRTEPQPC